MFPNQKSILQFSLYIIPLSHFFLFVFLVFEFLFACINYITLRSQNIFIFLYFFVRVGAICFDKSQMIWPHPRFNSVCLVFLISIEIDLLTSNQKRKNGQYDRGVCVCYEPLLGFFFQKMILFSKRLCVCECFSLVYPIACLIFLSLSSLSRVYSCTVSFFF